MISYKFEEVEELKMPLTSLGRDSVHSVIFSCQESPPEPDVLGEISDGVIIALHLMADLKLVHTWVLYLNRGEGRGRGGAHCIITDDNPLIEGWGNYDHGEISFFNQVNVEASRGRRRCL